MKQDSHTQRCRSSDEDITSSQNQPNTLRVNVKKSISQRRYTQKEQALQNLLNHKYTQFFMFFMVGLYTLLIFVVLALEDSINTSDMETVQSQLNWLELAILLYFISEILVSTYAWGIKKYYKDKWMFLDSAVICLSLFFVIFEITSAGSLKGASKILGIIQAVFRFLRIILLLRKAQAFKRIKTSSSIKTPAERIVDFLQELKELTEDIDTQLDLDYCVEKISSNQLYEAAFLFEDDQDAADWIKYGGATRAVQEQPQKELNQAEEEEQLSAQSRAASSLLARVNTQVLNIFKEQHDDLYINPFELHGKEEGKQGMVQLMLFLFAEYDLLPALNTTTDCFAAYFSKIWEGYNDNPYHNKIHSFDIVQTANFFLKKCGLIEVAQLSQLDISNVLIAGAIHDYNHPGFNNLYMVNTKSDLALDYNDKSVLEAYHVSASFKIMLSSKDLNISAGLTKENFKKMRESIIGMVLSTDMAGHFAEIAKFKTRLGSRIYFNYKNEQIADFDAKTKDKQQCLEIIIHASDISNPFKGFDVVRQWTDRLFLEFWNQGDNERQKGLPISYLCDRYTTNIAKSQAGFIDYVVRPLVSLLPNLLPHFETFYQNLDINKGKWAELVDYYQKSLDEINKAREAEKI